MIFGRDTTKIYVSNAKKGKGKQAIGIIVLILGGIAMMTDSTLGGILVTVGIGLLAFGKLQNWWHWK